MLRVSTFKELLHEASRFYGDQPFLADDEALGHVSYAEMLQFAAGLEKQFEELGIPVGASVSTLFHNCGISVLLFLSVIACRRTLVPLDPLSTRSELTFLLEKSQCVAVILDPSHVRSREFGGMRVILITDHRRYFRERLGRVGYSDFARASDTDVPGIIGEIMFTSASTGRQKGVLLSERSLIANAKALAYAYDLSARDRFLTVCPLFHNSGQVFTTLACALVGGSTVAVKSDVGMLHFWHYADKYRANWSLGMTSFLALLLSRKDAPARPETMYGFLIGGSVIDAGLVQRFEKRFGVPVRTIYGLTESTSISTCEWRDPNPRSPGSSGRPLPACVVRIMRHDGNLAAPGEPPFQMRGEIWISGETIFERYVSDPDLSVAKKRDNWLQTGDVGYFDEFGNLFVVDRLDSMIIVGGENVYPAEVERLCSCLPDAEQVVLVGIDHEIWGKELVLVYRARRGTDPDFGAWHRILTETISSAKLPQTYVDICDLGLGEFPRKGSGKIDRSAIANLLQTKIRRASVGENAEERETIPVRLGK
jgi:acyl-CoA synthetase (AMP-forming)/AMP-acid ligase II